MNVRLFSAWTAVEGGMFTHVTSRIAVQSAAEECLHHIVWEQANNCFPTTVVTSPPPFPDSTPSSPTKIYKPLSPYHPPSFSQPLHLSRRLQSSHHCLVQIPISPLPPTLL